MLFSTRSTGHIHVEVFICSNCLFQTMYVQDLINNRTTNIELCTNIAHPNNESLEVLDNVFQAIIIDTVTTTLTKLC